MSIVAMRKFSLCGLVGDEQRLLSALQDLGCMHLIPLSETQDVVEVKSSDEGEDAEKALKFLLQTRDKRRQVREDPLFDLDTVVRQTTALMQRIRQQEDRRDALLERIEQLEPWGDYHLPLLEDLGGRKFWFYVVPVSDMKYLEGLEWPWAVVHKTNRFAYVVLISATEPPADALPVARTHTGSLSLSEVRRRLEFTEIELEELNARREALTRWIYLISQHLAAAKDQAARQRAAAGLLLVDGVFALQGWVPEARVTEVFALAEREQLAAVAEPPTAAEQPPTLLENTPQVAAGEDLVRFYQTPDYRAWDPSRVLFGSFALFFAMILSDAGYAALLGVLLVVFWGRLGRSPMAKRMRSLSLALVGGAAVWGVLVGSYFGVAPAPDSFLGQLKVLDINDFDAMMRLSVIIGVLHLVLANAITARTAWGQARAGVGLGWIAGLLGGLVWWLGWPLVGIGLLGGGLAMVFFFSGTRRPTTPAQAALRVLEGLGGLTNVTRVFGDVLSYLRLFALGLASASLALTFNDLAGQVADIPGPGLLLSILILLIGHALNLALALLSGVVHGLRLNFIEFYNWGLSGEGYPFRPFAKQEVNE